MLEMKIKVALLQTNKSPTFLDSTVPFVQVENPDLSEKWIIGNTVTCVVLNELAVSVTNIKQLMTSIKETAGQLFRNDSEEFKNIRTTEAIDREAKVMNFSFFRLRIKKATGDRNVRKRNWKWTAAG